MGSYVNGTTNGTSNGELHTTRLDLAEAHGAPLQQPIPSFRQLLADSARDHSENIALISMHQASDCIPIDFPPEYDIQTKNGDGSYLRWSHGQLQYAAQVLASGLQRLGVRRGEPIATLLNNCAEWAILVRTAPLLGCPFVPLNPRGLSNIKEVEHSLSTSKAQVLVVQDVKMITKLQERLSDLMQGMKLRISLDASDLPQTWYSFNDILETHAKSGHQDEVIGSDENETEDEDVALIVYTSGTTSLPKGGIHTNKSISSSLLSQAVALKLDQSSRTCCHMPLHHIGGINMALGFMIAGGSTVFPSSSFDPAKSLEAINREKCTNLPCVPAMLQILAGHPEMKTTDTSSLRNVEMGATTILTEHLKQVYTAVKCKSATNSYSATEQVPVTLDFFDTTRSEIVSVGHVCAGSKLRICAPGSRSPLSRGEAGELHMGGPMLIRGYVNNESSENFYDDAQGRWFISGDQGTMAEDGSVTISGRYKDLIIRGGDNIAPATIEAVLESKLATTAQVIGVRSEESGEVPVAVIQSKDQSEDPTTKIRQAVLEELGPTYVPEKVYDLEELGLTEYPKTSSGKVRKVELKEVVQELENEHRDDDDDDGGEATSYDGSSDIEVLEKELGRMWHKIIGVDVKTLNQNTSITDFADSLTIMRFRNRIKRKLGLEVTNEELLEAGTIKEQAALLSSKRTAPNNPLDLDIQREGPPGPGDIAMTLGNADATSEIREEVIKSIKPLGFTWEDDVEDVLPSWDLGYEVFGSVAGTAKVNHRVSLSTYHASVEEVHAAIRTAIQHHGMHRSFELRGLHGEPTMRVIMRPNEKWYRYAIADIPEVENPNELVKMLEDGAYFYEIEPPYPSFLIKVVHIKSTNTAGMLWALQHSAFDGLALYSFLEDLDSLLLSKSNKLDSHIPYKLWADMYYLHRSSLSAKRSVNRQIQRLSNLSDHTSSLFPASQNQNETTTAVMATQRKTFVAPMLFAPLPHISELRTVHGIPPFILIKAALVIFLARKTNTGVALFSQSENGRSWPFVESWMQSILPDCMDLAGPTLERTVQILAAPSSPASVLSFLLDLKEKQDSEAQDVHAPWNLVRSGLKHGDKDKRIFDAAAMSTCLNYLPVRTRNGKVAFDAMEYHETKANCETAWLFNCGVEGDAQNTRMWTQIFADEDLVSRDNAVSWAREVMDITSHLGDQRKWNSAVTEVL